MSDYPFGHRRTGEGRQRDSGPNVDEQAAVARIVELRRAGQSYRQIAATLDAEAHHPRRAAAWSAMSVRNVALRELVAAGAPIGGDTPTANGANRHSSTDDEEMAWRS